MAKQEMFVVSVPEGKNRFEIQTKDGLIVRSTWTNDLQEAIKAENDMEVWKVIDHLPLWNQAKEMNRLRQVWKKQADKGL